MKQQARCAARPRLRKVWSLTFTASSIAHSFRHRRLSPMQTDTCQLKTLLSNRHLQSLRGMGMHPPPCMDLLKETSREATQRIVLPLAGGSEQGWLLQRAQHKISTANECKNWGMASPRRSQIWIVPRGPPKKKKKTSYRSSNCNPRTCSAMRGSSASFCFFCFAASASNIFVHSTRRSRCSACTTQWQQQQQRRRRRQQQRQQRQQQSLTSKDSGCGRLPQRTASSSL